MNNTQASTQENVPIAGIKDGILILKTGQYRIVLEVAAINFSLKSEEEQNSLVMQYQGFINSLHFPIQIVVRSTKLDLSPYINRIKKIASEQKNELIKMQTEDYADFVGQLINLANIMKKNFYVIVGYDPINLSNGTFLDKFFKKNQYVGTLKISEDEFEKNAKELRQRAQTIAGGLGGLGLHCQQVGTKELIELFYGIYNPEIAGKERLADTEEVSSSFVTQLKPEEESKQSNKEQDGAETPTIDNKQIVEQANKQQKVNEDIDEISDGKDTGKNPPNPSEKKEQTEVKPEEPIAANQSAPLSGTEQKAEVGKDQTEQIATAMVKTVSPAAIASNNAQPSQPQATPSPNPIDQAETAEVTDPSLNKDYGW